jgi:hypothetical protein
MDRAHKRHGAEVKRLFVYPLVRDVGNRLMRIDAMDSVTDSRREQGQ